MSIRLDPRRLQSLKQLAAEAGLRPGELVLRWVEERLDAERRGGAAAGPSAIDVGALTARIDELAGRVAALEATPPAGATPEVAPALAEPPEAGAGPEPEAEAQPAEPRRRGRPRKAAPAAPPAGPRVALHDEIIAVIEERGPSSAADIAAAIAERGRYAPPRSGKGLDAATVNSRVSNPAYRERFTRLDGRIGLARGE
jgi:hypothetical protein